MNDLAGGGHWRGPPSSTLAVCDLFSERQERLRIKPRTCIFPDGTLNDKAIRALAAPRHGLYKPGHCFFLEHDLLGNR